MKTATIRFSAFIILLINILGVDYVWSQNIGVNNPTPDPSAVLDVTSTDKGLLVPRVSLVSTLVPLPITAPATGLLIFNTATAGTAPNNVTPGFYFWDGTKWNRFDTGSSGKDWSVTGNAATDTTVNFVGTTDNEDLVFRRGNVRGGRIGVSNTSFGLSSMAGNNTSIENASFGVNALQNLTSGQANTAIGFSSGLSLLNGSGNTLQGTNSGRDLISGFQNTAIGALSMLSNTNGNNNVAIGFRALSNNTSGSSNVAIGVNALGASISPSFSNTVAVGDSALIFNATNGVTAIGSKAGQNNTTGSRNTYVGFRSGQLNSVGSGNTAVGNLTLRNATSAQSNVAIGDSAAFSTTTGNGNISIGQGAGFAVTSGSSNTMIGLFAGRSTVFGSANTFVGSLSGRNATGSFNSFFGQFSGANVTSGQGNVIVGHSTAVGLTSGNNNTVMGWRSGTNLGFASYNTLIGDSTNIGASFFTNASAIGSKAFVNGSNKMVLGSVAGVNGATSNVDVGIGTTSPLDRLHVVGNIRMVDGNQAVGKVLVSDINGTASWQTPNPSDFNAWGLTGNSGTNASTNFIGTTDNVPLQFRQNNTRVGFFDVSNVMLGNNAGIANTGASSNNTFVGRLSGSQNTTGITNTFIGSMAGLNNVTGSRNTFVGSSASELTVSGTDNASFGYSAGSSNTGSQNTFIGAQAGHFSSGNGNVYVGRNAGPNLQGSNNIAIGLNAAAISSSATGDNNIYIGPNTGDQSFVSSNSVAIGANATFSTSNSVVIGAISGTAGATVTHNVGIGTSAPVRRLHVALNGSSGGTPNGSTVAFFENNSTAFIHMMTPDANENGLLFGRPSNGIGGAIIYNNVSLADGFQFRTGGNATRMVLDAAGNLGVGVTAPTRRLHVRFNGASGAASLASAVGLFENNGSAFVQILTPDADESGLAFGKPSNFFSGGIVFNNTSMPNGFQFRTGGNFTRMVLDAGGNVGIGVVAPAERLEVAGNVNSTNGDFYGGALNGVINMGGGIMNPLINIIADVTPTPLNADGDEDLYIADDIELGGQGFKPGGGSWATASDARLKKDVQPFSDGLDKVLAIKPVSFKYNDKFRHLDNGKTYVGVIAQEIKEVAPYTVELTPFGQVKQEDENGVERILKPGEEFYSYDSSALTYMLINAVKELKNMNDEQNRTIEALKTEIELLKISR